MLLRWLRNRRRARLRACPFPADWEEALREEVAFFTRLPEADRERLRDRMKVFVAERKWVGCNGLTMNERRKGVVAAQACRLTLGLNENVYDGIRSVLLYPGAYRDPTPREDPSGLVDEEGEVRLGEAWYRGPIVLSWQEVLDGARETADGNVVLHEFAHRLDMLDGHLDGTPPLPDRETVERWRNAMTAAFERLKEDAERDLETPIDPYGTTDAAEFFATATEAFFLRGAELRRHEPAVYDLLRGYYRQDPASGGED